MRTGTAHCRARAQWTRPLGARRQRLHSSRYYPPSSRWLWRWRSGRGIEATPKIDEASIAGDGDSAHAQSRWNSWHHCAIARRLDSFSARARRRRRLCTVGGRLRGVMRKNGGSRGGCRRSVRRRNGRSCSSSNCSEDGSSGVFCGSPGCLGRRGTRGRSSCSSVASGGAALSRRQLHLWRLRPRRRSHRYRSENPCTRGWQRRRNGRLRSGGPRPGL